MAGLQDIITRLRRVVEERERELEEIRSLLGDFERTATAANPAAQKVLEEVLNSQRNIEATLEALEHRKRQRGSIPPRDIALAVRDVLLSERRPMKRGELVAELEKRGIPLAGADKNKNLGTILWRHKSQFTQIENLGYWLRDVPLEGVYTP